jgi:hypothetical protein
MTLNSNALTTLVEAKKYLSIVSSDTSQDSFIERLINTSSQTIEQYCSRKIKQTSYTEYYDGRNSNKILLNNYPASKPSAVYSDSVWTFDSTSLLDSDDYDIVDNIELVLRDGYFPIGRRNIKVTYQAGYATVPSDLEQACLMLVDYLYMHYNDRRIGVSSKSKNGENISYIDKIPEFVKSILDNYKKWDFYSVSSESI